MRRIVAVAALLGVVGAACGDGEAEAGVRLVPLGGAVEVRAGDVWEEISEPIGLAIGQEIRAQDGRARIEFPDGDEVELAPGAALRLTEPDRSDLLTGSVLATTSSAMTVGLGDIGVHGEEGTFRVDRGLQHVVRVYEGHATLPGAGWDGTVLPFRQIVLVAGGIASHPSPLRVDPNDPWDLRLFGEAMDIGLSLDRLATGLHSQLGRSKDPKLVSQVAPDGLPPAAVRSALQERPVGRWASVVVAAVLASRLAEDDVTPRQAFLEILTLRDLGASWILVAAEWGFGQLILEVVSSISGALAGLVAPPPAPPSTVTSGASGSGGTSAPPGDGGGGGGGDGGGGGGDGGGNDDDGGGGGDPPPPPECQDVVCEVVDGVIGGEDTGGDPVGGAGVGG